jgi:hypothetical protein
MAWVSNEISLTPEYSKRKTQDIQTSSLVRVSGYTDRCGLNFTQKLIALFFSFSNIWYDEKTNFTQTIVVLICINQTGWNLYII